MLSCMMREHHLSCGRWTPGNSTRPQPLGSRKGKGDLLLFLAASCSADLERPCWFSQSGRAPKPRKSGLPGCSGEHRVLQVIEESEDGEASLLAAARRTLFLGSLGCFREWTVSRGSPGPADCALCPGVQREMQGFTCVGMAPPSWIAAHAPY